MKRYVPFILLILAFAAICFLGYFDFTAYNEEEALGNTAGNLLNGGLFCEDEGVIYFSNPNDQGTLYSMDLNCGDFKKLHNDNASYINAAGKYIIYARNNQEKDKISGGFLNFNRVGLYRIDKSGKNSKTLYTKPSGLAALKGNYIYYQHYDADEGLHFYKVKLNGSDETILSKDAILPAAFSGSRLYYCGVGKDHSIHYMDLDNDTSHLLYEGNCYHVLAYRNYLYFISLSNGYAVARMNLDGTDPVILVQERVSFLNLSMDGKYLYCQVDGGDHNRLCRLDLETQELETVLEGNYSSIHTTSNYVFFQEFETGDFYKLSVSDNEITPFNPPVLE